MTTLKRAQKITSVLENRQQGVVVLEDIYDPHNAAAVLRSCDAFGFQTVYFVFKNVKAYNPKRVGKSSSASANKWLTLKTATSIEECYTQLKAEKYTIYATSLSPHNPVSLYEPLPFLGPRIALVFGNEHAGISEYAAQHANYHLHITMRGFVESFNISVCAALTLAEVTRQRNEKGMEKYVLDTSQKSELKKLWK